MRSEATSRGCVDSVDAADLDLPLVDLVGEPADQAEVLVLILVPERLF